MKRFLLLILFSFSVCAQTTRNIVYDATTRETVVSNLWFQYWSTPTTPTASTNVANKAYVDAISTTGDLTTATILGDSITAGANASASADRWHQVVIAGTGWAGTQIGAWGGAKIEDIAWQAYPGIIVTNADYSPTTIYTSPTNITEDDVLLALVGYNDNRGSGSTYARRTHFRNTLRAIATWWALPAAAKTFAQDAAAETGAWSDLSFYSGTIGRTSPSGSGSITFSNIIGDAIYLGYQANTSGTSTFTVTVDGRSWGTFNNGPSFSNAAAFAPPYVGPNGDGTIDENPWALRIAGLGMSAHTVVVTVTSGVVDILWCGGNSPNYTTRKGPLVMLGNTIRSTVAGYNSGDDASTALYNIAVNQVADELRGDGLKVLAIDAASWFNPTTGMSGDDVHPNDTGHAQIAAAFTAALGTDYQRSKHVENRSSMEPLWVMDGTELTLRVPNTLNTGDRAFAWDGGALPFRSATFNSPSISGSFDYSSGTSAHSSGTVRYLDIEHTLSESGTAGSVGVGYRSYIGTLGSGSHYPALFNTSEGSTNWNNLRLDLYGDGLAEGLAVSGGRIWYWRDPTLTGSQVAIKYADSALARRLILSGNSVVAYDTNGVAANLAIGATGVNVAVQGALTVAQAATVTGKSTLNGGLEVTYNAITTNTTITAAYTAINVNDTSGSVTLTLPTAASISGQWFAIKKTGGSNSSIIDPSGSETIEGLSTYTLASGQSVLIESDGVNWHIKADTTPQPYKTIAIPASFFAATATSPATATTQNNTTNNTTDSVWSFSGSADNYITCSFPMPEKWDGSTLKAKFFFRSSSTSTNSFIWNIATGLSGLGDQPDIPLTNSVTATVAGIATAYLQNISSATATVTPVGDAFAAGDTLRILVGRDGDGDGNTDAALLEAVVLQYRETATEPSAW